MTASNEFADVQYTYNVIERLLKQLETHEDVNHQRLLILQNSVRVSCGYRYKVGGI